MTKRTYQDLHSEMAEWLEGILKDELDPARFATVFIEEEEPLDGEIHIEVKGRHCRSGNPTTARFDYYDDTEEDETVMTRFSETDAGRDFIASGNARETSREIMEAIAFFARNSDEAESLWAAPQAGTIASPSDIWEHVTRNGLRNASDYVWGAAGTNWASHIGATEAK